MITALTALIPTRAKILAVVAVVGGVLLKLALWRAKNRGRKEAVADAQEADRARSHEIERKADEVHRDHDGMSDADVGDWLRDHAARRD